MNSNDIPSDRLESLRAIKAGIGEHPRAPDAWVEYTDGPEGVALGCEIHESDDMKAAQPIANLIGCYCGAVIDGWIPPICRLHIQQPEKRHVATIRDEWVKLFAEADPKAADGMIFSVLTNAKEVDHG